MSMVMRKRQARANRSRQSQSGARLDELCALKITDAHRRTDEWWIAIREGKTQAAVREVPIHIERRRKSSNDGYLFAHRA
jgi:hypothetical protein